MLGLLFAFQDLAQSPQFIVSDLAVTIDIIHVPGGVKLVVNPIEIFPLCVAFVAPEVRLGGPELNLVNSSVVVLVVLVEQGLSFGLTKVRVVHHGAEALEGLVKVSVSVAIDVDLRPESVETRPA